MLLTAEPSQLNEERFILAHVSVVMGMEGTEKFISSQEWMVETVHIIVDHKVEDGVGTAAQAIPFKGPSRVTCFCQLGSTFQKFQSLPTQHPPPPWRTKA